MVNIIKEVIESAMKIFQQPTQIEFHVKLFA